MTAHSKDEGLTRPPCPFCGDAHVIRLERLILMCRACGSTSPIWNRRSSAERGMREALEKCAAPWDSGPTTVSCAIPLLSAEFQRRLNIAGEALAALSARAGEGDEQATRADDGPTASTDRL